MIQPEHDSEQIQRVSPGDEDVILFCQPYFEQGIYGAIEIKETLLSSAGVFTTMPTKNGTVFCLYDGEVSPHRENLMSRDDSIMTLLEPKTGKCDDRLVILANKFCNVARFFNGVDQNKSNCKHEANVSSRRILLNKIIRVILFANRDIEAGEELRYQYGTTYSVQDL
jgi:SET domain-containing protein